MNRRHFLRAGGTLLLPGTLASAKLKAQSTAARIVIAGGGLGGLALASRLSRELEGARITLIDGKTEHNYQPGYTLVATGVWPVSKVRDKNADFMPAGVNWVQDWVAAFEPDKNTVVTRANQRIEYDFLIVATGLELNYGAIEGMDIKAIGQNGLASVYPGPDAAVATWQAMDTFRRKGGQALMTLPSTPLKCAGAPLKMTFMLADRLRQAGTAQDSDIRFLSALPSSIFGVKPVNDDVVRRWEELGIGIDYSQTVKGVDIGARKLHVQAGDTVKVLDYDFLHLVPPMRAVEPVRNSDLAWQDGAMKGWLETDPKTLRHKRYGNVFGIGDINGTPRGKTAATVKKSAPIVVHNLRRVMAGAEPDMDFDGYTSCPLIVREGSALLVEFDYEGRLVPSIPGVQPLQDSYFAWLLKMRLLKPAYLAVLKGRA